MATLESEIREVLATLAPARRRQVLEYARALERQDHGVPGDALVRFAGSISAADLRDIAAAVEEGCEGIDPHAW